VKMFVAGKTRMIVLPYVEKNYDDIIPFSSDTGTLWTDRWTDGQTDRFAVSISRVSMLTRDKKELIH